MLMTSTRSRMSRPASSSSLAAQVGGEVLVERGEQHVLAVTGRQPVRQVLDPVQGDDRLAGARAAADPRGAVVGTLDDLALERVQEDLPAGEVPLEDRLQRRVVGSDQGRGPGQRRRVVGHVDRLVGAHRRGHLLKDLVRAEPVVQREQYLRGELRARTQPGRAARPRW